MFVLSPQLSGMHCVSVGLIVFKPSTVSLTLQLQVGFVTCRLLPILVQHVFSRQVVKKMSNIKISENLSSGSRSFQCRSPFIIILWTPL